MEIRTCHVFGYWFTFQVSHNRRRLIAVDGKNAYGDYWESLVEALRLLFGRKGE